MSVGRCVVITLVFADCLGQGLEIRTGPFLKWLGNIPGQNGRRINPEKDSILVPVTIVGGNHGIIIKENPPPPTESKGRFSLLDLISKGRSDIGQLFLNIRNMGSISKIPLLDSSTNAKCSRDIEEFHIYPRYYNGTAKCYIPGKGENPCPRNMQFYLIPGDPVYGVCEVCDCKLFVDPNYRPLVHSASANQCFYLYEKGDCEEGQWITLDSTQTPTCTRRECPETDDPSKSWFLSNSTCYQLLYIPE